MGGIEEKGRKEVMILICYIGKISTIKKKK